VHPDLVGQLLEARGGQVQERLAAEELRIDAVGDAPGAGQPADRRGQPVGVDLGARDASITITMSLSSPKSRR